MSEEDIIHHSDSEDDEVESTSPSPSSCKDDVKYTSLKSLFASLDQPAEAESIFKALKPYIEKSIKNKPNSAIHREILNFMDNQLGESVNESIQPCTMAQVHAIVYVVNENQILIQDDASIEPKLVDPVSTESDLEYNVFMDEMAKL